MKIDGVSHEFSTIDGVTEDVSEIILNLKKIRFKMTEDAITELINFEFEGPDKLNAKELNNYLSDFEVINGNSHIATLNKKIKLTFEMRISRGKGYVPSEKNNTLLEQLLSLCRIVEKSFSISGSDGHSPPSRLTT